MMARTYITFTFQRRKYLTKHVDIFAVAEWLMHLTAILEVMGLCPSFGNISYFHFLESIQSPAQRNLKWSWDIAGFYCDL